MLKMERKRYNALYYARNKERILAKRKKAESCDSGALKHRSQGCMLVICGIGILIIITSIYESYKFYRMDSSCEYAALKALVIELALLGLPFLGGLNQRFKYLGGALVLFSGLVMMFSCLKEFCQTSAATSKLPNAIVQVDDQLKLYLDRLDLYEKRGWATRAHELSQDVKKLILRRSALEAELDAKGPVWLQGFQLLLQSFYRLLLMIVAWVYVSAIARRQDEESP
jgi:hypothetical protein